MGAFGNIYRPGSLGSMEGTTIVPSPAPKDCWKRVRITLTGVGEHAKTITTTDDPDGYSYGSHIVKLNFTGTLKKTCECLERPEEPEPSLIDADGEAQERTFHISFEDADPVDLPTIFYDREDITKECKNCKKKGCYCEPSLPPTIFPITGVADYGDPFLRDFEILIEVPATEVVDGDKKWTNTMVRNAMIELHDKVSDELDDFAKNLPEDWACNEWKPAPPRRG